MTKFRKGNNSGFSTGTLLYNRQRKTVKPSKSDTSQTVYERLTRKMTSLVQNISYKDNDIQSANDTKPTVLLRPRDAAPKIKKTKKSAKKNQRSEDSSNRTGNVRLNAIMWNSVFREHQRLHLNCKGFLQWNMEREEKFGLLIAKRQCVTNAPIDQRSSNSMKKKDPGSVSLQADGAYNNAIYILALEKKPFQPATQVVYSVAEAETEDKSIIGVVCKNKLCSVHPIKSGEKCTSACSSNLTFMKSIGDEYTWAKEALQDLASDGIEAKHLTTDPDSSAYRAADDLYLEKTTSTEPEHFLDTRHFLNNHRKNIENNKELGEIIPGGTKKDRKKLLNNFALDLAERCQSEFTKAMEIYDGDFVKVKNKISFTVDAIPACYTGNHELCRRHSFVCKGGKKFWLYNRAFLPNSFKIRKLDENLNAVVSIQLFIVLILVLVSLSWVICKQLWAEISPGSAAEKELMAIQKTDRMQKAYKKNNEI
ncbi:unnamed protein product [Mytilus coruscus]|uniref:Mutator-like transposase domain-containing protein n=1 Tax=Mytilus coruscus TaxID=42192 RepID=A0A6J8DUE8_MYTCO|nr:unnamed protein product [Mytilus coruscus]